MTKGNAKAIIACNKAIQKALNVCKNKLSDEGQVYMENYWGKGIQGIMDGRGYGSMPIDWALDILSDKDA